MVLNLANTEVIAEQHRQHVQSVAIAMLCICLQEHPKPVVVTGAQLEHQPVGVLAWAWNGDGSLSVVYIDQTDAEPADDTAEISLGIIVRQNQGLTFPADLIERAIAANDAPTGAVVAEFVGSNIEWRFDADVVTEVV